MSVAIVETSEVTAEAVPATLSNHEASMACSGARSTSGGGALADVDGGVDGGDGLSEVSSSVAGAAVLVWVMVPVMVVAVDSGEAVALEVPMAVDAAGAVIVVELAAKRVVLAASAVVLVAPGVVVSAGRLSAVEPVTAVVVGGGAVLAAVLQADATSSVATMVEAWSGSAVESTYASPSQAGARSRRYSLIFLEQSSASHIEVLLSPRNRAASGISNRAVTPRER